MKYSGLFCHQYESCGVIQGRSNKGHPYHVIRGTEGRQRYGCAHFQPRSWVGVSGQSTTLPPYPRGNHLVPNTRWAVWVPSLFWKDVEHRKL
jgi:hypothetical protein